MNKLLSAGFARLWKDKSFWIGSLTMLVLGIGAPLLQYMDQIKMQQAGSLDNSFFVYAILIGIVSAAFSSLFLGTEYHDGTIRNKIVVGHSRSAIYLSSLIVVASASLLFCLASILPSLLIGLSLFGPFEADGVSILALTAASLAMTLAYCSIFTMTSLLIQNKSAAAVWNLLGFILLFVVAVYLYARLNAPKLIDTYTLTQSTGGAVTQAMPNPQYLQGSARTMFQFLLDFLPTGQALQITNLTAVHLWQMPAYALLISISSAIFGALAFQNRDIK